MINTFARMGVPVGIFSVHREDTCVIWALGNSGTENAAGEGPGSCVNLECRRLMAKVAVMR